MTEYTLTDPTSGKKFRFDVTSGPLNNEFPVVTKCSCWSGHEHSTPEEARECIDAFIEASSLSQRSELLDPGSDDLMAAVREIARGG